MVEIRTEHYKQESRKALRDPVLQRALSGIQARLGPATAACYRNLPEGPALRRVGHDIRRHAIENLDVLLETLSERVRQNGGQVFFARDAGEAVAYCLEVARAHGVRRVVKGKSMVTEEIGLNQALAEAGIEAAETDLGEFIVQIAGEHPSHIIAPAIHKTRVEIGQLFSEKLGIAYTDDPPQLTQAARKALRRKFLAADMGISGCNLACAETGHITTLSNEGNIRMASTLPKVHIAFMGMERVVACPEDHDALFRLLSRGAAAQSLAGYISYVGGPALDAHADGPEAFHLVILDNGRSQILADPQFREMLCCLRCGACLNVCPVYGKIGGHAYGYPYSGPVGAVVTPLLVGVNRAKDLCMGESLCGACRDACPVDIDIPRMLLALRAKLAEGDSRWQVKPVSRVQKALFGLWAQVVKNRRLYELTLAGMRLGQRFLPAERGMITRLPAPAAGWTLARNLRPVASASFVRRWKKRRDKE